MVMSTSNRIRVKKEDKKSKLSSVSTHVTLTVKGQDGEEPKVFKIRRNVKMRKLMEFYNDKRGVEWNTFVFIRDDGSRIREFQTPNGLKLKDGDQIDAIMHQDGGFGSPSYEV